MPNLPVRRVVLYKHGVGYFEREAAVTGEQTLALTFKQREVSDVLKSLTVLDLGGGLVSAVSYDSTTPADKLLAEIALTIPDTGSLVNLLPQLKGARVAVRPTGAPADQFGVILGIDTAEVRTPAGVAAQPRLSVLADGGEVQTFDLFDVAVQLLDDGLRRDLDFYLRTQLAAKKKDARTFTLFAAGEGERTVRVSYVLEAPVWKATYRILLGEPAASAAGLPAQPAADAAGSPQPLIQGWAVVDNTSDEDWEDVDLTLVAGLPVSFVHDLYTPRYVTRPVVEVQETTGVLPPMAEAGFAAAAAPFLGGGGAAPPDDYQRMMAKAKRVSAAGLLDAETRSAVSSVATQTRERQVGDLFEYAIDRPVTVRRNQSALVPIVLKPFAGRSVLLYQKHARAENPIRCVEFENTTGLTLEGGPVTVLEAGSYVGEAMLDTLKPTEQRLVGYAVELAVRVTDSIDSKQGAVTRVVIRQGLLTAYFGQAEQTTYTFAGKADREQVLYLDHPRPGGDWELFDTPAPHEVTENYWRFRLTVPPHATTRFAVKARRPLSQSYHLDAVTEAQFAAWVKDRFLPADAAHSLRGAIDLRRRAAEYEARLKQLDDEREKIHREQARIRENLAALADRPSDKELRERYLRTLTQQEDRLDAIDREAREGRAARDDCRARIAELLAGLDYEAAV